ncbi:MAG: GAF domain-containing protein [bacterium]|nr:MAG: GAF domain-containing protein [bacterium]
MKEARENGTSARENSTVKKDRSLRRLTWRNWFFLAGMTLLTTIGLSTALPPLLSERIVNPWPWVKTDLVLIVGLSITVIVFVIYLTKQQGKIARIHQELVHVQDESNERTRRHYIRLLALFNVSRKMGCQTDLQEVFDHITRTCVDAFTCERASLMIYQKLSRELIVRSTGGAAGDGVLGSRQKIGEGIAGWAAEHREALLLDRNCNTDKYPGLNLKNAHSLSAMVVPIIVRDELIGVLNVSTRNPKVDYDQEDLRALRVFAENAGTCIRHTEQADWMRKTIRKLQSIQSA